MAAPTSTLSTRSTAPFRPIALLLLAALCGPGLRPAAADWPQIRGRDRDGLAHGETLLRSWEEDGPAVVWRRAFGAGFSGVSAVGDRLYTMAAEGESEEVLCLDAATGKTLWRTPLGERFTNEFGDGPRSTPTVEDGRVFAVSTSLRFAALSAEDGRVLWQHDLGEAFGAKALRFGYSSSPLVEGDLVILDVGGEEGNGVVAFDRESGAVCWSALGGPGGHSSPVVLEAAGRRQILASRLGEVVSLSLEGEVLWRHPVGQDTIVLPLPVPPAAFFTASSVQSDGGTLLRVAAGDAGPGVETLWHQPRMRNHFNPSVRVGGHLYGFDNATLRCLDAATGEPCWAARGFGKGSLVAAGDLLFVLGDKGTLALVEANPEAYVELGRTQALEGRTWTAPSLDLGRLYLRDHDEIVSLAVGGTAEAAKLLQAAADAQREEAEAGPGETAPEQAAAHPAEVTVEGSEKPRPLDLEAVLALYAEARGGLERWREVQALEISGAWATFSREAPFTLRQRRGGLYRLEYSVLGFPTVKARDEEGLWWIFPLLGVEEPARVEPEHPYRPQLAREALFEPPLLDPEAHGAEVKLLGPGELDGRPTLRLGLFFPNGAEETWHLDPETYLEVAVDSTVFDHSQMAKPFAQRAFYGDFRQVGGLVLPHRVALELGARLEEVTVEKVRVDPELPMPPFRYPGG